MTRAVQSPRDRPAGEFFDLGEAADLGPQRDLHGGFLLGSAFFLELAAGSHLAEQFAELDQPLARLRAAADARRWQRQHLHQRQLMGDQIAVQQLLPSLFQTGCASRKRLVSVWSL